MTSIIASQLHQPMSEILSWTWDEIVDRYGDAIDLRSDDARFQARLVGAKLG